MLARCAPVFLLALAPVAAAGTVSQTVQSPQLHYPATYTVPVQGFDVALGHLDSVTLSGSLSVSGAVLLENTTASAQGIPLDSFCGAWIAVGSAAAPVFLETSQPYFTLPPFDGTLDYGGPSAFILPISGTQNYNVTGVTTAYTLAAWSAPTVDVSINLDGFLSPAEPPPLPPQLMQTLLFAFTATPSLTITYTYSAYPEMFCTAHGFMSGGQCPCGGGAGGDTSGCPNSASLNGAYLTAFGPTSLTGQSLNLVATTFLPNTIGLFFEGTQPNYVGMTFGEGKRCVGGSVRRLGVVSTAGQPLGMMAFPGTSGAPSLIATGIGYRCYQCWYRDVGNACTPSTFNLTNAVGVVWTP